MEIYFKDPVLQEFILDKSKLTQKYGPNVAKATWQRVAEILACVHLEMLHQIPCGLHPLKRKRKGQFAVDLGPAFRLVFEPAQFPLPRRPDGAIIWEKVTEIRLLEIVDYHDERY
jgi:plasmid maintenance system killer protein